MASNAESTLPVYHPKGHLRSAYALSDRVFVHDKQDVSLGKVHMRKRIKKVFERDFTNVWQAMPKACFRLTIPDGHFRSAHALK